MDTGVRIAAGEMSGENDLAPLLRGGVRIVEIDGSFRIARV